MRPNLPKAAQTGRPVDDDMILFVTLPCHGGRARPRGQIFLPPNPKGQA